MKRKSKSIVIVSLAALAAVLGLLWWVAKDAVILKPMGSIATQQRDLMAVATLLMLLVVIPVFVLTFFIAWKYRATNTKAHYTPKWDGSRRLELLWWAIPFMIIFVLSIIIWYSSHQLDPYRPLTSKTKPVEIQVIALQWKWLFIYPEHNLASVNFVQFPEDTPVNFRITSDAPMNSFWIPQLGGQVYAMSGMETKLHLEASRQGDFTGTSANLSGEGFTAMRFIARASSAEEFEAWMAGLKAEDKTLSQAEYDQLLKPSSDGKTTLYRSVDPELYDRVIMKYMMDMSGGHSH